jgi:hypothetical protein
MTFAEIRDSQGRILVNLLIITLFSLNQLFSLMEKFGEQCPVVFASIVTKPASECVCVGGGGGGGFIPPSHRLNMAVEIQSLFRFQ